jgi:hypothetical protein
MLTIRGSSKGLGQGDGISCTLSNALKRTFELVSCPDRVADRGFSGGRSVTRSGSRLAKEQDVREQESLSEDARTKV